MMEATDQDTSASSSGMEDPLEDCLKGLNKHLEHMKTDNSKLRSENRQLKRELRQSKQEIRQKDAQLNLLKERYKKLYTSWMAVQSVFAGVQEDFATGVDAILNSQSEKSDNQAMTQFSLRDMARDKFSPGATFKSLTYCSDRLVDVSPTCETQTSSTGAITPLFSSHRSIPQCTTSVQPLKLDVGSNVSRPASKDSVSSSEKIHDSGKDYKRNVDVNVTSTSSSRSTVHAKSVRHHRPSTKYSTLLEGNDQNNEQSVVKTTCEKSTDRKYKKASKKHKQRTHNKHSSSRDQVKLVVSGDKVKLVAPQSKQNADDASAVISETIGRVFPETSDRSGFDDTRLASDKRTDRVRDPVLFEKSSDGNLYEAVTRSETAEVQPDSQGKIGSNTEVRQSKTPSKPKTSPQKSLRKESSEKRHISSRRSSKEYTSRKSSKSKTTDGNQTLYIKATTSVNSSLRPEAKTKTSEIACANDSDKILEEETIPCSISPKNTGSDDTNPLQKHKAVELEITYQDKHCVAESVAYDSSRNDSENLHSTLLPECKESEIENTMEEKVAASKKPLYRKNRAEVTEETRSYERIANDEPKIHLADNKEDGIIDKHVLEPTRPIPDTGQDRSMLKETHDKPQSEAHQQIRSSTENENIEIQQNDKRDLIGNPDSLVSVTDRVVDTSSSKERASEVNAYTSDVFLDCVEAENAGQKVAPLSNSVKSNNEHSREIQSVGNTSPLNNTTENSDANPSDKNGNVASSETGNAHIMKKGTGDEIFIAEKIKKRGSVQNETVNVIKEQSSAGNESGKHLQSSRGVIMKNRAKTDCEEISSREEPSRDQRPASRTRKRRRSSKSNSEDSTLLNKKTKQKTTVEEPTSVQHDLISQQKHATGKTAENGDSELEEDAVVKMQVQLQNSQPRGNILKRSDFVKKPENDKAKSPVPATDSEISKCPNASSNLIVEDKISENTEPNVPLDCNLNRDNLPKVNLKGLDIYTTESNSETESRKQRTHSVGGPDKEKASLNVLKPFRSLAKSSSLDNENSNSTSSRLLVRHRRNSSSDVELALKDSDKIEPSSKHKTSKCRTLHQDSKDADAQKKPESNNEETSHKMRSALQERTVENKKSSSPGKDSVNRNKGVTPFMTDFERMAAYTALARRADCNDKIAYKEGIAVRNRILKMKAAGIFHKIRENQDDERNTLSDNSKIEISVANNAKSPLTNDSAIQENQLCEASSQSHDTVKDPSMGLSITEAKIIGEDSEIDRMNSVSRIDGKGDQPSPEKPSNATHLKSTQGMPQIDVDGSKSVFDKTRIQQTSGLSCPWGSAGSQTPDPLNLIKSMTGLSTLAAQNSKPSSGLSMETDKCMENMMDDVVKIIQDAAQGCSSDAKITKSRENTVRDISAPTHFPNPLGFLQTVIGLNAHGADGDSQRCEGSDRYDTGSITETAISSSLHSPTHGPHPAREWSLSICDIPGDGCVASKFYEEYRNSLLHQREPADSNFPLARISSEDPRLSCLSPGSTKRRRLPRDIKSLRSQEPAIILTRRIEKHVVLDTMAARDPRLRKEDLEKNISCSKLKTNSPLPHHDIEKVNESRAVPSFSASRQCNLAEASSGGTTVKSLPDLPAPGELMESLLYESAKRQSELRADIQITHGDEMSNTNGGVEYNPSHSEPGFVSLAVTVNDDRRDIDSNSITKACPVTDTMNGTAAKLSPRADTSTGDNACIKVLPVDNPSNVLDSAQGEPESIIEKRDEPNVIDIPGDRCFKIPQVVPSNVSPSSAANSETLPFLSGSSTTEGLPIANQSIDSTLSEKVNDPVGSQDSGKSMRLINVSIPSLDTTGDDLWCDSLALNHKATFIDESTCDSYLNDSLSCSFQTDVSQSAENVKTADESANSHFNLDNLKNVDDVLSEPTPVVDSFQAEDKGRPDKDTQILIHHIELEDDSPAKKAVSCIPEITECTNDSVTDNEIFSKGLSPDKQNSSRCNTTEPLNQETEKVSAVENLTFLEEGTENVIAMESNSVSHDGAQVESINVLGKKDGAVDKFLGDEVAVIMDTCNVTGATDDVPDEMVSDGITSTSDTAVLRSMEIAPIDVISAQVCAQVLAEEKEEEDENINVEVVAEPVAAAIEAVNYLVTETASQQLPDVADPDLESSKLENSQDINSQLSADEVNNVAKADRNGPSVISTNNESEINLQSENEKNPENNGLLSKIGNSIGENEMNMKTSLGNEEEPVGLHRVLGGAMTKELRYESHRVPTLISLAKTAVERENSRSKNPISEISATDTVSSVTGTVQLDNVQHCSDATDDKTADGSNRISDQEDGDASDLDRPITDSSSDSSSEIDVIGEDSNYVTRFKSSVEPELDPQYIETNNEIREVDGFKKVLNDSEDYASTDISDGSDSGTDSSVEDSSIEESIPNVSIPCVDSNKAVAQSGHSGNSEQVEDTRNSNPPRPLPVTEESILGVISESSESLETTREWVCEDGTANVVLPGEEKSQNVSNFAEIRALNSNQQQVVETNSTEKCQIDENRNKRYSKPAKAETTESKTVSRFSPLTFDEDAVLSTADLEKAFTEAPCDPDDLVLDISCSMGIFEQSSDGFVSKGEKTDDCQKSSARTPRCSSPMKSGDRKPCRSKTETKEMKRTGRRKDERIPNDGRRNTDRSKSRYDKDGRRGERIVSRTRNLRSRPRSSERDWSKDDEQDQRWSTKSARGRSNSRKRKERVAVNRREMSKSSRQSDKRELASTSSRRGRRRESERRLEDSGRKRRRSAGSSERKIKLPRRFTDD